MAQALNFSLRSFQREWFNIVSFIINSLAKVHREEKILILFYTTVIALPQLPFFIIARNTQTSVI